MSFVHGLTRECCLTGMHRITKLHMCVTQIRKIHSPVRAKNTSVSCEGNNVILVLEVTKQRHEEVNSLILPRIPSRKLEFFYLCFISRHCFSTPGEVMAVLFAIGSLYPVLPSQSPFVLQRMFRDCECTRKQHSTVELIARPTEGPQ